MNTPEWEIFERIESLEKLRPTVDDVARVAVAAFQLAFMWIAAQKPSTIRKIKDGLIKMLKNQGVSKETLDSLQTFMLQICDEVEK